jgi:hypothetical protein
LFVFGKTLIEQSAQKSAEVKNMQMKMSTENMAKIGGAAMAIGAVSAVAAAVVNSRSTKSKMKKLAKKSIKTMDNIVGNVNSIMK